MALPAVSHREGRKSKGHGVAGWIWEEEGYYPIINQHDEILMQAIQFFDKAEELSRHN